MSKFTESDLAALGDAMEENSRTVILEKRRNGDRWKIDKTVSPALIITAVTFIGSGTLAYADLKRSDDLLKAETVNLHELFTHMEKSEQASLETVLTQYKELNSKVDRLIERQITRSVP